MPRGEYLNVVVTPELRDWLEDTRQRTGLPMGQFVRFVLEMVQRDEELLRRALTERLDPPAAP